MSKKGQVMSQLGSLGVGIAILCLTLTIAFLVMSTTKTTMTNSGYRCETGYTYINTSVQCCANTPAGLAAVAIAGAPNWSETVSGIGQLATDAEAVTGTATSVAIVPSSLTARLAAPGSIGATTPAAGAFTTLAATGAINFDGGGSLESGGTAISIGADASADAINLGTGAAARTITIGNVTGATGLVLNSAERQNWDSKSHFHLTF